MTPNPMNKPPKDDRAVLLVLDEDKFLSGRYDPEHGWLMLRISTAGAGFREWVLLRKSMSVIGWIEQPTIDLLTDVLDEDDQIADPREPAGLSAPSSAANEVALTALCIYEAIADNTDANFTFWDDLKEDVGDAGFRQVIVDLAPKLNAAHAAVHPEHLCGAFDWQFVPTLLCAAIDRQGDGMLRWSAEEWQALARAIYADKTAF